MSVPSGNSFVSPRLSMFPSTLNVSLNFVSGNIGRDPRENKTISLGRKIKCLFICCMTCIVAPHSCKFPLIMLISLTKSPSNTARVHVHVNKENSKNFLKCVINIYCR